MAARNCAWVLLLAAFSFEAQGHLRAANESAPANESVVAGAKGAVDSVGASGTGAMDKVAATLPSVPEPPLPAVGFPVTVPLVGSQAPHTANPAVCGILGGVIVLNWVLACCCAFGGAAAAGGAAAEGSAEGAGAAGGTAASLFACVECAASICSIIALVYVCYTGLVRAWLGGQAVGGWCLALAIIGTLQLVACVCICCCATCGAAILGEAIHEKYIESHSKHVMGGHLHDMVHKHKPTGTHPITDGHLPIIGGQKNSSEATEKTPLAPAAVAAPAPAAAPAAAAPAAPAPARAPAAAPAAADQ